MTQPATPDPVEALAVRRYVWMRNAGGGQRLGNLQVTVPLTAEVFARFLAPYAPEGVRDVGAHLVRYPGVRYLALFRQEGREWQLVGGEGLAALASGDPVTLAVLPPDATGVTELCITYPGGGSYTSIKIAPQGAADLASALASALAGDGTRGGVADGALESPHAPRQRA